MVLVSFLLREEMPEISSLKREELYLPHSSGGLALLLLGLW
jgi:hypothetical protein